MTDSILVVMPQNHLVYMLVFNSEDTEEPSAHSSFDTLKVKHPSERTNTFLSTI